MKLERQVTWPEMRDHLMRLLSRVDAQLRRSTGEAHLMLQGRAQLLEELLNLPSTFAVLDEADAAEKVATGG